MNLQRASTLRAHRNPKTTTACFTLVLSSVFEIEGVEFIYESQTDKSSTRACSQKPDVQSKRVRVSKVNVFEAQAMFLEGTGSLKRKKKKNTSFRSRVVIHP